MRGSFFYAIRVCFLLLATQWMIVSPTEATAAATCQGLFKSDGPIVSTGEVKLHLISEDQEWAGEASFYVRFEVSNPSVNLSRPGVYDFEFRVPEKSRLAMDYFNPDLILDGEPLPVDAIVVNGLPLYVGDVIENEAPWPDIKRGWNPDGSIAFYSQVVEEFAKYGFRLTGYYKQDRIEKNQRVIEFRLVLEQVRVFH